MVGFWFLLISLGQAYPYAVVYAHVQEEQCGCNEKGRSCIHGCQLKKRPKADSHQGHQGSHGHAAMKHDGHHGKMQDHAAMGHDVAQEPSDQDHWISPNCSQQKTKKILSFQNEPFLPSAGQVVTVPAPVEFISPRPMIPAGLLLSCDDPPPKEDDPPKDPA